MDQEVYYIMVERPHAVEAGTLKAVAATIGNRRPLTAKMLGSFSL